MTIHDRALAKVNAQDGWDDDGWSPEIPIANYLRAFLNDAELVEKVETALTSLWMKPYIDAAVYGSGTLEIRNTPMLDLAKAALDTIKKEAGI